ncbi:DedA family protein [Ruminiclostridium papyrosolvens]|uniref:Alkaline phosphatase n=1 Tax=Ruminiclostridium papyrosolvens C7 TaxID=1330534 RepID=U4R4L1_9FIRM|nr:DedA family protein [Ruminiclostridium papyrosolvens]EPR12808.1 alkaline phosphatase [Ruminiclostridium papyrosolvens C7]
MTTIIHNILMPLIDIIEGMGIWGIGLWMLFESSCIPLPSEIILPFGGMMASQGSITLLEANIAAAVGSLIGSMFAYFVGSYGGRPFILKYGKYFFVSEKNFYKAEEVFKKRGMLAVCLGRLLPVIRTFISLPAGIAKINKFKFIIFSTIGMLPWNFTLIYLGYVFGKDYETKIRPYFKGFENIVIALILICIVLFVIYKIISSRRESNKSMGNK